MDRFLVDVALQNALAEKTRIEGEISVLRERLRLIDSFIAMYGEFADGRPPLPMPPALDAGSGKKVSIPDAVSEILANSWRPIPTATLLIRLKAKGINVGGEARGKRIANLSSALSRDDRFENVRGEHGVGWQLREARKEESPTSVGAEVRLDDLV